MKCEQCASKEAVIKLVRVERGGHVNSTWVCADCAAEASPYQAKLLQKPTLSSLFLELSQKVEPTGASGVAEEPMTCPTCGLDFRAYKKTAMLGCQDCYDAFADQIEDDLERIHRTKRHVGSEKATVTGSGERQRRLKALREELGAAVEREDFEEAARLRDEVARTEDEIRAASFGGDTEDASLDDPA